MKVQILGGGCPKCRKLIAHTEKALEELGLDCKIEKVTQIADIMTFGVMSTPALVVDGNVKLVGKVASVEEIKKLLAQQRGG